MQMSKNKCQFIINLVKLPNGFAFDSLVEPQIAPSKKKIVKKAGAQNSTSKSMNRIARQLALDFQQPLEPLSSVPEEIENRGPLPEPQIEEEIQVDIRRQNELPACPALWYDQMKIHDLQKVIFPEFFKDNSYKTPNLYMKYRNFIVVMYRKNPTQYLTKIACRRILRGDVNSIMKIHTFLEKEGLINFGVSKDGNYSFVSTIFSKSLNPQTNWPNPTQKMSDKDEQLTHDATDLTNLTVTLVNKNFSKGNRVFCKNCQMICGLIWYNKKEQTPQKSQTSICLQCFQKLSEKQADNYNKIDIVKRSECISSKQASNISTKDINKPAWGIQDNLKLLENISKPQNTWQCLKQKYENRKSEEDIVLQFMQFPISNFDENKQKIKQPVLSYDHKIYTQKLIDRLKQSAYNDPQTCQDVSNQQIPQNQLLFHSTKLLFKGLCSKYELRMAKQNKLSQKISEHLHILKNQVEFRDKILLAMQNTPEEKQNCYERIQIKQAHNDLRRGIQYQYQLLNNKNNQLNGINQQIQSSSSYSSSVPAHHRNMHQDQQSQQQGIPLQQVQQQVLIQRQQQVQRQRSALSDNQQSQQSQEVGQRGSKKQQQNVNVYYNGKNPNNHNNNNNSNNRNEQQSEDQEFSDMI